VSPVQTRCDPVALSSSPLCSDIGAALSCDVHRIDSLPD
jgi:hypothetical protein